jgi:hypothetical protein
MASFSITIDNIIVDQAKVMREFERGRGGQGALQIGLARAQSPGSGSFIGEQEQGWTQQFARIVAHGRKIAVHPTKVILHLPIKRR